MSAYHLFSVEGKTAVITGGARGVGAMIAHTLVQAGAEVLIISRDSEENRAFAKELGALGRCQLIPQDLGSVSGVDAAATAIDSMVDVVHILVNNAGTFTAAPLGEVDMDAWDRELAMNLRTPFQLVQALLPKLRAGALPDDPARVINIGSIAGLWPKSSKAYAYGASKAALHHLTRMMASDLTRERITVNAIAPGFFPSDMTDGFFEAVPGLREQMIESIPAQRLGAREDIGGTVLFLASRAGSYLSGAVLPLEGGLWSA